MSYTQLSLFTLPKRCHIKGCTEMVVGFSMAKPDAHVCKKHNEIEWAQALSQGKDGYWKMFGKRWLEELTAKKDYR